LKLWTVRWQLTIWNTVVLATLLSVLCVAMLSAVHLHLLHQSDQFLMEELDELVEDLNISTDPSTLSAQLTPRYSVHSHFHFQVLDAQKQPLFRSRFLSEFQLPTPPKIEEMRGSKFEDIELPLAGEFRLLSMSVRNSRSEPLLLQVVAARSPLRMELGWYLTTLLTALPFALLVSLIAGYLLARRALRPLDQMAFIANRISVESLNQRLEVRNPHDELGRLATTLNGMFDRLRASVVQIRQFTSDAAHELRSPIAALRTQAEVTLRSDRSSDEYRRVVQLTLEESTHMSELVDQLLLLSRHDSGQQSVMFEDLRVDQLLLDVVDRFRPLAEERGLLLELSGGTPWMLAGDDIWLSQLFWNLLDNAGKYTPRGGAIRVSSQVADGQWCCSIQDTGPGIVEQHLPFLFNRFYRVDASRTRDAGGTGLGLAICKSIAEAHAGRISVTSQVGRGSEFTVTLPGRVAVIDVEESSEVDYSIS